MLKFILRPHQSLEQWEISAKDALFTLPALNVDETSLRGDKKNHWIPLYSAGDITVNCLHRRRGIEAIDAINIVPRYGGIIIHDGWASYFAYPHCGHALCGSHLLRELIFIVDSNGYAWAANMKRLLTETCVKVSKIRQKELSANDYANVQKRFRNILTRGGKELSPIPPQWKTR